MSVISGVALSSELPCLDSLESVEAWLSPLDGRLPFLEEPILRVGVLNGISSVVCRGEFVLTLMLKMFTVLDTVNDCWYEWLVNMN
jgi:hypothetical protein